MSCSMTVDAVRARTKTVTRRRLDTWTTLKAGDRLTLIEKGMGLKKGDRQVKLAEVEVVDVRVESLYLGVHDEEPAAEGFPEMEPSDFIEFWLESHGSPTFRNQDEAYGYQVRRIEWRYLDQ